MVTWKSVPLLSLGIVLLVTGLLAGCGRIQTSQGQDAAGLNLTLTVEPAPPAVGKATLVIDLADEAGRPISDAALELEGNMTHAGMAPVFGRAAAGENGRYRVPFEWTMAGDWVVTVKATLADGRVVTRQVPVSVE